MANVVRTKSDRGNDFFPLAVHYSERAYSAGKSQAASTDEKVGQAPVKS